MASERFLIAPFNYRYHMVYLNNIHKDAYMSEYKTKRNTFIDIKGKKFSDLTVIEFAGKGKYRGAMWLCRCVCGKECIVYGGHLRSDKRKSCGCRSQARIFETGINRVFSNYKRKAFLRKMEFLISKDVFGKLIMGNCHYCGSRPSQELKRLKTKKLQIKYNGIDRYNPDIGYTNENCVSCCYYCNHAKLDLTFEQWLSHLKRIYKYQGITNGI